MVFNKTFEIKYSKNNIDNKIFDSIHQCYLEHMICEYDILIPYIAYEKRLSKVSRSEYFKEHYEKSALKNEKILKIIELTYNLLIEIKEFYIICCSKIVDKLDNFIITNDDLYEKYYISKPDLDKTKLLFCISLFDIINKFILADDYYQIKCLDAIIKSNLNEKLVVKIDKKTDITNLENIQSKIMSNLDWNLHKILTT